MTQVETKPKHRLKLLRELYEIVLDNTESFKAGAIGADLAYLMGAVLSKSYCDWDAERPLVQLLREHFPGQHPVWDFVHVEWSQGGGDVVCQTLSERELATILAALRFWQRQTQSQANPWDEVASDGGQLQPLGSDEIDRLCERLNMAVS